MTFAHRIGESRLFRRIVSFFFDKLRLINTLTYLLISLLPRMLRK